MNPVNLIYRNQLQTMREDALHATTRQFQQLQLSIQQRVRLECELHKNLTLAQQTILNKDNEITALQQRLHQQQFMENTDAKANEVKRMTSKNEQLRNAQYHVSMKKLSEETKTLKEKLAKQKAFGEMAESRMALEMKSFRNRIDQSQKTIRNLKQLRETEQQKFQQEMDKVKSKILDMKKETKATLLQTSQATQEATKACDDRDALMKQLSHKNALLKESRNLLAQQKQYNAALQEEMKKIVIRNERDIEHQARTFQETLLTQYHERNDQAQLLQRVKDLAERKMSFIAAVADNIGETKQ